MGVTGSRSQPLLARKPRALRGAAILAWGLLLLLPLGCRRSAGVALTVNGLRSVRGFSSLVIAGSRDGAAPRPLAEFGADELARGGDGDTVALGLKLDPEEAHGRLQITASALPAGPFVLGSGSTEKELEPGRTEMALTLAPVRRCSESRWCWELPTHGGRQLEAIWGAGPKDIWVGGAFGTLLHFDGRLWSPHALPEEAGELDVHALWGGAWNDVWAVADRGDDRDAASEPPRGGALLRFDGQRWTLIATDPSWRIVTGLSGVAWEGVWISGSLVPPGKQVPPDGFITHCTAAGCEPATLLSQLRPEPAPDWAHIGGVWTKGAGAPVWAAGWIRGAGTLSGGTVLRRQAGRWEVVAQLDSNLSRIWGSPSGKIWAGVVSTDLVFRSPTKVFLKGSDDRIWEPVFDLRGHTVGFPLWEAEDKGLWAILAHEQLGNMQGTVGRLGAGVGATWTTFDASIPSQLMPMDAMSPPDGVAAVGSFGKAALHAVYGTSTDDVWAVGDEGMIRHYDGKTWEAAGTLPVSPPPLLRGMFARSPSEVWAVGTGGTLLRYDGVSWAPEVHEGDANLLGVFGAGDSVFAVGEEGTLLRRRGAAAVWTREAVSTTRDLFAIWGSGPNDLWAVGDGGTILLWNGTDWAQVSGTGPRLLAIGGYGAAPGPRWAVGCAVDTSPPTLAALRFDGAAWSAVPPQDQDALKVGCYTGVDITEDQRVWLSMGTNYASTMGIRVYDERARRWLGSVGRDLTRCLRMGGPDLWCPSHEGRISRGDGAGSWSSFNVGGRSRLVQWNGLYSSGKDLWLYGSGLLHCTRGEECADGRY